MDLLSLLPQAGAIRLYVKTLEKQLNAHFGTNLQLSVHECSVALMSDTVAKLVSDILSITVKDILGNRRDQGIADARHITMYLLDRYAPGLSLKEIGHYFGKDHTAVIHARQKVKALIDAKDKLFMAKLTACEEALRTRINKA